MGRKYDFKYIVIGSGPAGSTVALNLAKHKKRVALVEARFFGGANLNTLDVPYSVALDFSHHYSKTLTYPELKNQDLSFSFPTISARQLSTVIDAGGKDRRPFEDAGVVCLSGYANFLDKHTIAVNHQKFTSEYFILATGSELKVQDITGTETVNYLTPETAIKLRRLPKVVAVVGAGSTGCEIAEYYAELGVNTILFEMADRILPREDKEVSTTMNNYFIRKLGMTVLPTCKVVAIEEDNFSKRLIFRFNNSEKMVRVDTIVLATGTKPVTNYGLENAGVKYKDTGISSNRLFQTSAKHIYAIGDCLGGESSTDRAELDATTLSGNLINNSKTLVNYKGLIRLTRTNPAIATVGRTEEELTHSKQKFNKVTVKLDEATAGKIYHQNYGFVKLLASKAGNILGACIVAPEAGLLAQELALAVRHNLTALEIASTPHLANTDSEVIRLAAKKLLTKKRK